MNEHFKARDLDEKIESDQGGDPRADLARDLKRTAGQIGGASDDLLAESRRRASEGDRRILLLAARRVLAVAAVLALVSSGVTVGARNALPGDPLWNIRRVGQVIRVATAGDATAKAKLLFDQSQGASQAAISLAEAGKFDQADGALEEADKRYGHALRFGEDSEPGPRHGLEEHAAEVARERARAGDEVAKGRGKAKKDKKEKSKDEPADDSVEDSDDADVDDSDADADDSDDADDPADDADSDADDPADDADSDADDPADSDDSDADDDKVRGKSEGKGKGKGGEQGDRPTEGQDDDSAKDDDD